MHTKSSCTAIDIKNFMQANKIIFLGGLGWFVYFRQNTGFGSQTETELKEVTFMWPL